LPVAVHRLCILILANLHATVWQCLHSAIFFLSIKFFSCV
jgi:hypothetical protein